MKIIKTLLLFLVSLNLFAQTNSWNEYNLKEHWKTNGADEIEGIYEIIAAGNNLAPKYKLALKKHSEDLYNLIYLSGATGDFSWEWKCGDTKAILTSTAKKHLYKVKWYVNDKSVIENVYINFDAGFMNVICTEVGYTQKQVYLKLYPAFEDKTPSLVNVPASGTGFAISSDGYIVTNFHVTNGASSIKVRGINEDFSKVYYAKVIVEDKNNDISIIKIDDIGFLTLETIPYIIQNKYSDVGSSVFCLGYPLRASMGDEVKLTNGIISSKSGFQGDITTYQITAPVQPGNSGGPVFDDKGNLIGIINAKHAGAENASYAVKASYLINLIDLLSNPPKLQAVNSLAGKTLTQQVEFVKKFVYIIETE